MIRYAARQLVGRLARSLALVLGVLIAVSAFVVLTSHTDTSRLSVLGTVAEQRGAFDILVRGTESVNDVEHDWDLVRPNFLSDTYGGVEIDQWRRIQKIKGVDVAAPVATLGTMALAGTAQLDLADEVPKGERRVLTLREDWTYDRGLSESPEKTTIYLTPNQLDLDPGLHTNTTNTPDRYFEVLPSGQRVQVCPNRYDQCRSWSNVHDERSGRNWGRHTEIAMQIPVSVVFAAIDPDAEAKFVGLDDAVTSGSYLTNRTAQPFKKAPGEPRPAPEIRRGVETGQTIPVLLSERQATDLTMDATLTDRASGAKLAERRVGASEAFRIWLAEWDELHQPPALYEFQGSRPTEYERLEEGKLRPRVVSNDPDSWPMGMDAPAVPPDARDVQFRRLMPVKPPDSGGYPMTDITGRFDPRLLPNYAKGSEVSLETYQEPRAVGADEASREALRDRALLPGSAQTSYVQQPPLMLTNLKVIQWLAFLGYLPPEQTSAPISGVRVRVEGVTGADEVSRERVRLVAEKIKKATELQVDIVLGSSPSEQTINLVAGKHGRPELNLHEWWSKKNVVATIVAAVSKKSVILFVLVLAVCAVFVANAAASSVRARRTELGVLACLGWGRGRLFAATLGELAVLGVVAGAAGVGAAWIAGRLLNLDVSWSRAGLAVPIAVLLAVLAGLVPAWLASRAQPMEAVRPVVQVGRRARIWRGGVAGLVVANTVRVKARTLLGAGALAIATAAVTLLVAVQVAFQGTIVGSVLGDAVSVQVRGADVAAIVAMVVLAVFAVADVAYLNIRDRASEFAVLRATGWTERSLSRLVVGEGALMGLFGASAGAVLGVAAALSLAQGENVAQLLALGGAVISIGVIASAAATSIPVALLRRLPTAQLLAEE